MIGIALDASGDIVIENNEISIVVGDELLKQKVWAVLRTNRREWFFDWEQGVEFDNLLGKSTNEELARYEIERGLLQVDSTFVITDFEYTTNPTARTAKISFVARTESGEEVGGEITWD